MKRDWRYVGFAANSGGERRRILPSGRAGTGVEAAMSEGGIVLVLVSLAGSVPCYVLD